MAQITHVIFGLNGTLLDIEVIVDLLYDFAKTSGRQMDVEIRSYIREMDSLKDIFYKFFDSINLFQDSDQNEALKQLLRLILYKGLKLNAGADTLVKHLYCNAIPMAIVSSGFKREFDLFGQKFGNYFTKFFTHSVCGCDDSEVIFNKPNPDLYLICAKRFPKPPKSMQNILIIEDSFSGITGAVASGAQTLLINDRKYTNFDSISDKINSIVNSFEDLKPDSIGLPAYGCCVTRL